MIHNELERGWLAGILEGEGSFYATKVNKKYPKMYPRASMLSTDEDVVRKVHELTGVGSMFEEQRRTVRSKRVWRWVVTGARALEVMLVIRDLMGDRRRAKIDDILATSDVQMA